jgi:hypothetical protein
VGATALNPGEDTTVSFTTAMHKGMEGPHLFKITVPARSAQGESIVTMYWRADFR